MNGKALARQVQDEHGRPQVRDTTVRHRGTAERLSAHDVWAGREVRIRDLRNPGRVLESLVKSGETAPVTRNGELVAWLVPATAAERRRAELIAQGRLRPGGGLAGRGRMPRSEAGRPLSDALSQLRVAEGR